MKIGIYAAHDDDAIEGVGGIIVQHLKKNDDVYITVCTDGRNSHKFVLDVEENPTPLEVLYARKKEFYAAVSELECKRKNIFYLDIEDGMLEENRRKAFREIRKISEREMPDMIYFHYGDRHKDHRMVSKIIPDVFNDLKIFPRAYQFFIWTNENLWIKKLTKGRRDIEEKYVPRIPKDVIKIDIRNELGRKRRAFYKMKSQISTHPYKNWGFQKKPIIDERLVEYFLRGKEMIVRFDW